MQKLMQEQRFDWTVTLENEEGLERDLVATSDGEEIARAGGQLAEELRSWGEDDGGLGGFACRRRQERESLAETLADIHSVYARPASSLTTIEQRLEDPQGLAEYQQAHRDAGAIVRTLGHTYSLTIMRQWLRDGVPTQVQETLR